MYQLPNDEISISYTVISEDFCGQKYKTRILSSFFQNHINFFKNTSAIVMDAHNGISNLFESFSIQNQKKYIFQIFRFKINLDYANVKNCEVNKKNDFKFRSRNKFCSSTPGQEK